MAGIARAVRSGDRLVRIGLILAKHGFGEVVSRLPLGPLTPSPKQPDGEPRTFPVRVREALVELGPSFVKLGQVASTRADLLPPELIAELRKLQNAVPPMPPAEVDAILEETYGDQLDTIFASFDRTPLAAASIGQVHTARLRVSSEILEETDVIVKLQRTGARATVERDLDLLYAFARLVQEHIPEARIYAPVALVTEFDRAITAELDYGLEADNAIRFAKNFEDDPTVRFPKPYRHVSGKRVLVMERFYGKHLFDEFVPAHVAAHPDVGSKVAKRALMIVCKMVFEHGFFHADPHPGNIIMLGDGADPITGLIDLGLVGRITDDFRDKAIALMVAAVTADASGLADALLGMGRPKGRVDLPAFRADVQTISEKYLGRSLAEIEMAALIRDLVQGAIKYDIELPAELMMMGKALMTVEGIGKQLDPKLDIWSEARPYFMKLLWARYNPQRIGKDLLRGVKNLSTAAIDLPGQLHDILDDARAGRIAITARDPDTALATERMGRRVFTAILAAALIGAATALLIAKVHGGVASGMFAIASVIVSLHWIADWRRQRGAKQRRS